MTVSVLIPTFNYDCRKLVRDLLLQLPPSGGEVIVGNDCSTEPSMQTVLSELASLPGCRVYTPEHNLGRAVIRNAIARQAKGDWLLFCDADAEVRTPSFVADYLLQTSKADVVCGGTGNLPHCPSPEVRLRYDYEVSAERRLTLARRRQHPYAQFTTFNFLIRRTTFLSICFDEHFRDYGHEDTAFGLELERRGISILHIDNKLTHVGIEPSSVYLDKTEKALRALASMKRREQEKIRVSALALRLRHLHLLGLVRWLYQATRSFLLANLTGRHPSQLFFAFYKLGYLSVAIRRAYPRQSGT